MKKLVLVLFIFSCGQSMAKEISVSLNGGLINTKIDIQNDLGQQISTNLYYSYNKDLTFFLSSGYFSWQEPFGLNGNEFSSIPLLIGVRLPISYNTVFPYFSAEMGLEYIKREYTKGTFQELTDVPDTWIVISTAPKVESNITFKSRIALGMFFQIDKNIAFDMAFKYSLSNYQYSYFSNKEVFFPAGKTKRLFLYDFAVGILFSFD